MTNNEKLLFGLGVIVSIAFGSLNYVQISDISSSISGLGGSTRDSWHVAQGISGSSTLDIQGNTDLRGTLAVTGEIQARNVILGDANGALPNLTFTTTSPNEIAVTAANACDNTVLDVFSSVATTGTIRLPSTTVLISDCLDTLGDTREFSLWNITATTSFTFGVGGSSTLLNGPYAYTSGTGPLWLAPSSTLGPKAIMEFTAFRVTSSGQPWTLFVQRHAQ